MKPINSNRNVALILPRVVEGREEPSRLRDDRNGRRNDISLGKRSDSSDATPKVVSASMRRNRLLEKGRKISKKR